jgi:hypothetical protein
MKTVKTWPWKSKIFRSLTMYLYTPHSSQPKEWLSHFSKISRKYKLNQKYLKSGAKSTIITTCHIVGKPLGRPP